MASSNVLLVSVNFLPSSSNSPPLGVLASLPVNALPSSVIPASRASSSSSWFIDSAGAGASNLVIPGCILRAASCCCTSAGVSAGAPAARRCTAGTSYGTGAASDNFFLFDECPCTRKNASSLGVHSPVVLNA